MFKKELLPEGVNVTREDLANTPPAVLELLFSLIEEVARLNKRIEELEARLDENSSNSNKPPSTDSPFDKESPGKDKKNKNKKTRGKGRKGSQQKLMTPTDIQKILPGQCDCGCTEYDDLQPYYTHQHIELPEIIMTVIHFVLHKGRCKKCGRVNKGYVPQEYRTGYGSRLSALIAEIGGNEGNSRQLIKNFCSSVLGFHISLGAIQNVIDRASAAIKPHYNAIGKKARSTDINHVDETPWNLSGKLTWLWVMTSSAVAFFKIHNNRSKKAFEELIGEWAGTLVADGYAVYQKWAGQRQTCIAHLIRRAKGLSERSDPELARCGAWVLKELRLLCKWAKDPPTAGELQTCYMRLCRLIDLYSDSTGKAGRFVRHIEREMDALWTFLVEEGVGPTNNFAERMIRFAVLWRKRSQGTNSDKGCRWVERVLSLRQTCRLQNKSTYSVLVEALDCYFKDQTPDLEWIRSAGMQSTP